MALIEAEAELTDLDSVAGDGDLGASMKRGGEAVLALPQSAFVTPSAGLTAMGNLLRKVVGGSSGPFYAAGTLRAARHLSDMPDPSPKDWANAYILATEAIADLGGAKPGDRTMLDALHPAAYLLENRPAEDWPSSEILMAIAKSAAEGAEATKNMKPQHGRASYPAERAMGHPDAGAVACAIWLRALALA